MLLGAFLCLILNIRLDKAHNMNILTVKHHLQKVKELHADFAQKNRWGKEFAFEAWEAFQGKIYMPFPRP